MAAFDTHDAGAGLSLDRAAPVRVGEELPLDRLAPYLEDALGVPGPLHVAQFPSGHSNLTYLISLGGREYVLRRPPFGSEVKSAHDMGREFTILSKLWPVYPPAPRPLHFCEDPAIAGAPFYVMERVRGVIFRSKPPEGLSLAPDQVRACCRAFVENLAALHAVDYQAAGLGTLQRPGAFVERQVSGWARRYEAAKTGEAPELEAAMAWLETEIPPDSGAVIIHNDYKFDNVVVDRENLRRIAGVLDWEMSTIGDPFVDLGCALSYWIEPGEAPPAGTVSCFLTAHPGSCTRQDVADWYAEASGRSTPRLVYYYVFGLVKLAVIVQQIYWRYVHGRTADPRFAPLGQAAAAMGRTAAAAIERGRV